MRWELKKGKGSWSKVEFLDYVGYVLITRKEKSRMNERNTWFGRACGALVGDQELRLQKAFTRLRRIADSSELKCLGQIGKMMLPFGFSTAERNRK